MVEQECRYCDARWPYCNWHHVRYDAPCKYEVPEFRTVSAQKQPISTETNVNETATDGA